MAQVVSDHLPERARALFGVELNRAEVEQLGRFLDQAWTWSRRTNLVSVRSRAEIVDRHCLDSIAPLRFVRNAAVIADFGSGGGFPAVPLAILAPATRFLLVESRGRRATFLRHVVRTLDLGNVRVCEGRAERWRPEEVVDLTIGRAIRTDLLAELSHRVLSASGRLILMRKRADDKLAVDNFREVERISYDLPGGEEHEIVVLCRASQ